jgi:hypothetical protein
VKPDATMRRQLDEAFAALDGAHLDPVTHARIERALFNLERLLDELEMEPLPPVPERAIPGELLEDPS